MSIMINTDINAPCCPCEIVPLDEHGNELPGAILVDSDWDYPGFASSFGWSIRTLQHCKECGKTFAIDCEEIGERDVLQCPECECDCKQCTHDNTDGTVDCKCGVRVGEFICNAGEYLENNDGKIIDDPGYFDGGE